MFSLDASKSVYRTLAQPSQMGNFKHQTLRSSERDSERDRERGVRDREGLRNVRRLIKIVLSGAPHITSFLRSTTAIDLRLPQV
jgi:hypothetical protein